MKQLHAMMERLHSHDLAALFIRLAVGIVFVHAGWLKISDMQMVVAGFGALGIPTALAYVVAYSEFIGGLAMILGVFVRYAGVVLAIVMIVAILKVHLANGYGLANNGYEYTLALLLSSLAAVTLGAGRFSVASFFAKRDKNTEPVV